jgi:uncharacterized membrane protein
MTMFVLGLALWSVVHLMPSVAPGLRGRLMSIGEGPYKGLYALTIVGSLLLIIFGWRAAEPSFVYTEPEWGRIVNMATMLVGLILFMSGRLPTNIKRYLRHPQLTGVALWAVGHLLANGDSLSVLLFGVMGVWALVSMVTINRRDGAWVKPDPVPVGRDLVPVIIGVVLYAILGWVHPYIAGISIY